jgi:hypothetical protein
MNDLEDLVITQSFHKNHTKHENNQKLKTFSVVTITFYMNFYCVSDAFGINKAKLQGTSTCMSI